MLDASPGLLGLKYRVCIGLAFVETAKLGLAYVSMGNLGYKLSDLPSYVPKRVYTYKGHTRLDQRGGRCRTERETRGRREGHLICTYIRVLAWQGGRGDKCRMHWQRVPQRTCNTMFIAILTKHVQMLEGIK